MPYHRRLFQPLRSRRAVYYTQRYALVLARTGHRFLVHTARDERHDRVRRLASAQERATRPNPITQTLDDDEEERDPHTTEGGFSLFFSPATSLRSCRVFCLSAFTPLSMDCVGLPVFLFWVGLLTTGSLIERDTSKLRETTAVDEVCVWGGGGEQKTCDTKKARDIIK